MKTVNKSLILMLLAMSPALMAMDQTGQAERKQQVADGMSVEDFAESVGMSAEAYRKSLEDKKPAEAERKQTQAELDAIQFAKEKKAKQEAVKNGEFVDAQEEERCTLLAQAFEKLPGKKIRPKQIMKEIPEVLQTLIEQMHVEGTSNKHARDAAQFIAENTFALIPAITTSKFAGERETEIITALHRHGNFRRAFERRLRRLYPDPEEYAQAKNNHPKIILGGYVLGGNRFVNAGFRSITTVAELLGRPLAPSEVMYALYSDDVPKLFISRWDFESLRALSLKQLRFIASLSKRKRDPVTNAFVMPLCQLKMPFADKDEQIFKSLPITMQANLATYYNFDKTRFGFVEHVNKHLRSYSIYYAKGRKNGVLTGMALATALNIWNHFHNQQGTQ